MDDGWFHRLSATYSVCFSVWFDMHQAGCTVEIRPREKERLRREARKAATRPADPTPTSEGE
jgi:hypothetical protein